MPAPDANTLNDILYDFLINFRDCSPAATKRVCKDLKSGKLKIENTLKNREIVKEIVRERLHSTNPPAFTEKNLAAVRILFNTLDSMHERKFNP